MPTPLVSPPTVPKFFLLFPFTYSPCISVRVRGLNLIDRFLSPSRRPTIRLAAALVVHPQAAPLVFFCFFPQRTRASFPEPLIQSFSLVFALVPMFYFSPDCRRRRRLFHSAFRVAPQDVSRPGNVLPFPVSPVAYPVQTTFHVQTPGHLPLRLPLT